MSVINWSPELHNLVKGLKKSAPQNIAGVLDGQSLSSEEKQAVMAAFSKPEVHRTGNDEWG